MKKISFITAFVIIFALLAGSACSNNDNNGDIGGNGNQSETNLQWSAFNFGQEISPSSGDSGIIKSFTIEVTYVDEDTTRKFQVDGEYLGSESTDIKTQRMDSSSMEITTVSSSVECYQIKHHITVLEAPAGDESPEWVDVTVWIPTSEINTTNLYFWVYPKATYVDSEGNTGEWSYYLTEAMQNEIDQGTATYMPYTEGGFNNYDQWTLFGMYGWAWTWFSNYANGGEKYLEEGSWDMDFGGIGYTYSVTSDTENVGGYSFDAWTITVDWNYGGDSAEYKGIFAPDLPIPIFLKVGSSGEGSQNYFQYELTDLVLE